MIFTDEASFRQDSTLHATWSRVGHPPEVPVTGERKNVKILGGIELWRTRFHYREDTVFNASSYLAFLEQLARSYRRHGAILIQDNASYHKDADVWNWFRSNRHWLEVHQLPPYSPEFNPTERLWQHTRRTGTHNRFFTSRAELETTLTRVFGEMQCHPALIRSYLLPFCDDHVPLIMRSSIANGKRIPGLKLDHPRDLALMSALVRFCYVAAGDTFTTSELRVGMAEALAIAADQCPLGSVRYELSKLRGKGLVEKLPHSRRYRLLPIGYRICVIFLKLFHKIYAPLTAGLLHPYRGDRAISDQRLNQLDKLYRSIVAALDQLVAAVGIKVAA